MFAKIENINDLVPFVESNPQIRVKEYENGFTVVCYMLQDEDTFSGANEQFEVECRGITFHPDGRIASRNMHKFFNVGEREDTLPQNLDWSRVVRIMDKRDGSMITFVELPNGSIKAKTKKSFDTKEAELADEILHQIEIMNGEKDQFKLEWVRKCLKTGLTPTFEVTSPRFPIVLKYDKDELTLLHVRENVTGRYLSEDEIKAMDPPFNVVENLIEQFAPEGVVSWDLLKNAAETREGIEGWVIQFDDGRMVKLKTKWYQELHHSVTFTRWRDIARSVVADQADDLKAAFAMTGRDTLPIIHVERSIKNTIEAAKRMVQVAAEAGIKEGLTAKDMAMKWKEDRFFGLIMRTFRGQEVDWMDWYAKNQLDEDWDLEVVEVN